MRLSWHQPWRDRISGLARKEIVGGYCSIILFAQGPHFGAAFLFAGLCNAIILEVES